MSQFVVASDFGLTIGIEIHFQSEGADVIETSTTPHVPFADHRDLYLLVAGLILGILLGPSVLGRLAPSAYDAIFPTADNAATALEQFDNETQEKMQHMKVDLVNDPAIGQLLHERQTMRRQLLAGFEAMRDQQAQRLIGALLVALVLVMVLEAMLSPTPDVAGRSVVRPACRRLITVRYAIIALILAAALMRPDVILQLPLLAVILIAIVALIAGLIPLGPRRQAHR